MLTRARKSASGADVTNRPEASEEVEVVDDDATKEESDYVVSLEKESADPTKDDTFEELKEKSTVEKEEILDQSRDELNGTGDDGEDVDFSALSHEWVAEDADLAIPDKTSEEKADSGDDSNEAKAEDEKDDGDKEANDDMKASEEADGEGESNAKKIKRRVFKRRIVRIPKDVFEYMARIEEDGVVRLNMTQFSVFMANDLAEMSTSVEAEQWDTVDTVPVLDVSVPPTAKDNPTLIVDSFSNNVEQREVQEKRLQSILANKTRALNRMRRRKEGKDEEGKEVEVVRKQRRKLVKKSKKEQETPKLSKPAGMGRKRPADSGPSSARSGGNAAKVARTDGKKTTSNAGKSSSKRNSQSGRTAMRRGDTWRGSLSYQQPRVAPFAVNPNDWRSPNLRGAPMYGSRYGPNTMYDDTMAYGERLNYGGDRGGRDMSSWPRSQNLGDLEKWDSIVRGTGREASSFDVYGQPGYGGPGYSGSYGRSGRSLSPMDYRRYR